MSLVILFYAYFGYTLSIVRLLPLVFICSYSACLEISWTSGSYYIDEVSRWYILAETPFMPGRGVARFGDSTVESYVILPPVCRPNWTMFTRSEVGSDLTLSEVTSLLGIVDGIRSAVYRGVCPR